MGNTLSFAETLTNTTREIFHAYHSGVPALWFSYLDADSVYLGSGDPLLIGKNAIVKHFQKYEGVRSTILFEEYHPVLQNRYGGFVYGQIVLAIPKSDQSIVTRFTFVYKFKKKKLVLTHQHNSYEYQYQATAGTFSPLDMSTITHQFVRDLLIHRQDGLTLLFQSGTQTVCLDSNMLVYIQSTGKRTELVCIDRLLTCNSSISELQATLPGFFYQIHRSYLVNTYHILAIRRFEVELTNGTILPIPAQRYMQVKRELADVLKKRP